jgi:hypothetical protein
VFTVRILNTIKHKKTAKTEQAQTKSEQQSRQEERGGRKKMNMMATFMSLEVSNNILDKHITRIMKKYIINLRILMFLT